MCQSAGCSRARAGGAVGGELGEARAVCDCFLCSRHARGSTRPSSLVTLWATWHVQEVNHD